MSRVVLRMSKDDPSQTQSLRLGRLINTGSMILRYMDYSLTLALSLTEYLSTMIVRNPIVEEGCAQPRMVRMPSARWCAYPALDALSGPLMHFPRPVSYPIPGDGPVGRMLSKLERHTSRPAHLHIQIHAPGYEALTTALYFKGDPYLTSDAVLGVKSSLIVVGLLRT